MTPTTETDFSETKGGATDSRETAPLGRHSLTSVRSVRNKLGATLAGVQATITETGQAAVDKASAAVRGTDDYVHKAPWSSIGITALVALAIGFLLRRR